MLKVSLVALLVTAAAAPKKPAKKKAPAPPVPAKVEPAPEATPPPEEPKPVEETPKSDAPVAAPEPEPQKKPEPEKLPPSSTSTWVDAAPGSTAMKPASAVETTKPKLVVLEVAAGGGVDPTVAAALSDAITLEIERRGYFTPTSMKELQTMLGVERQRQLMGCSDAANQCMAELADAIGARFVLNGALTRLGDAYQLALQTIDTNKAQPIGRSVRIAKDPAALTAQVPYAVAEATSTQLPPPPSKVLQYTAIIGGAVLLIGSGILGLAAFTRDQQVTAELESAALNPAVLRTRQSYFNEELVISAFKTTSLIGVCVGLVAIIGGVLTMPSSTPGASAAVVPTGNGAALVGVFP